MYMDNRFMNLRMNKSLIILFICSLCFVDLHSQSCNEDSVVTTDYSGGEDGIVEFNYIRIDTFDIVNGIRTACEKSGSFGPMGPFSCL